MKYTLIFVSGHTVVARDFRLNENVVVNEIAGSIKMMRQVLICDGENVLFETVRANGSRKYRVAEIREIVNAGKVIRKLSAKEKKSLATLRYRATTENNFNVEG